MALAPPVLRTRIYVDGYNFYYGRLKRTPYKWLDPIALFEKSILPSVLYRRADQVCKFQLDALALKYFTAPILRNFASAPDSVSSQATYLRALEAHCAGKLDIIRGYYDDRKARAYRVVDGVPPTQCEKVEIWKLEEKQSDINLALHAYRDAMSKQVDQVVIVTNDTDLVPALRLIKEDTGVVVGLVVPTIDSVRQANADLVKYSSWVRRHITDDELAASQLPLVVPSGRAASHKPVSWYARPDLVGPAIEEAMRVRGGRGAAIKWLGQPNPRLGNQIPLEMLNSEQGAQELKQYMDAWAAEHP